MMPMLLYEKDLVSRIKARLSQSQTKKLTTPKRGEKKLIKPKRGERKLTKPKRGEVVNVEIFLGVSHSTYKKMEHLNGQFLRLLNNYDVYKMRRECVLVEPFVFLLANGDTCWTKFDKRFENFEKLPEIPSDYCFPYSDKETICAGTHLIVVGREVEGMVVWRYESEMHQWVKGPTMIIPRCMYGSASHGNDAFFAGGIKVDENGNPEVLRSVEKYNAQTKTWSIIQRMHKRRKFSSGCFLHGKFYVIGGRNENDEFLTCGESYDEVTNSWTLIPNMLGNITFMPIQSSPLIAVANNNLYSLEVSSNKIGVYDINTNTWKKLGVAPVVVNVAYGWGVAFKSIGDSLLLIANSSRHSLCTTMRVFTCRRPSPNMEELIWEELDTKYGNVQFSSFIRNCCVMFA